MEHGAPRRIYGVAGTGSRCRCAARSGAQLPGAALPRRYWVLDGGAVPERAWQDTEQQRAVAYSALLVQVRILLDKVAGTRTCAQRLLHRQDKPAGSGGAHA